MTLRWTLQALKDLESARQYLASEHLSFLKPTRSKIEQALVALQRHPHIGHIGRVRGTRELVIGHTPFLLVYRLEKDVIGIVAFMHSSRRWPDDFKDR